VPAAPADSRNPDAKHVADATQANDTIAPKRESTAPARPAELVSSTTLDSQSVAGAVASDPRFLTAIEERLNDPDPATQEAAAQLLDEFLDAAGVAEAPDANKP